MTDTYVKAGDTWVTGTPFQRDSNGWHSSGKLYVKVAGTWVETYDSTPVKPTAVLSSATTEDGNVQVTIKSLNVPVEKVVVHTGTTQYNSVPVSVTDRYTNRADYFRVFTDLDPGETETFSYPVSGSLQANTWYYSTAWAQDAAGVWHVLRKIRVNSGSPQTVTGQTSLYTEAFKPVETYLYEISTKKWTNIRDAKVVKSTAGNITPNQRIVFMFKDTIQKFFANRLIAGGHVRFQRFPDKREDGIYQLGFHTTNSPVAVGLDSYSMYNNLFSIPKDYSGTGVRVWTTPFASSSYYRDLLAAGTVRSISLSLHSTSRGFASLANAFYVGPSGYLTFNYRNRTTSLKWPKRTHEVI